MKCTTSPQRRLGWPVNTTHGCRYSEVTASLPRLGKLFSRPPRTRDPCMNGSSGTYTL